MASLNKPLLDGAFAEGATEKAMAPSDTFAYNQADVITDEPEGREKNFSLALTFSLLPFVFNATSKVITKEIASSATVVEYNWMGYTVPAGTLFAFPIFLATVQFFSNAVMAVITYKLTVTGSICTEMKEALGLGVLGTAQLTITKALSSIGAKTGLIGMPLSLYAVARSLGIPITQLMRIAVLKKAASQQAFLQTLLVFTGVALCFFAQYKIAGDAEKISSDAGTISWSFVAVFLVMGVFMSPLHGVYVEMVFDNRKWHPLVALAYENFAAFFMCLLLFPIFGLVGFENLVVVLICFIHDSTLQLLVLSLLFCKCWSNMCATYTIYYGDSFQRVALQRPAKIGSQMAIELIAYYGFNNVSIGRPWVTPWSFLVVFSMGLVVVAASFKEKKDKKNKKKNKANKDASSDATSVVPAAQP